MPATTHPGACDDTRTRRARSAWIADGAASPFWTLRKEAFSEVTVKRSVLVVEDDPLLRMFLAGYLEQHAFEVHQAEHAEAALAILESTPDVQIVVTDVRMPGAMDGRALAHYVRARWPPTLLVVASGVEKLAAADLPVRSTFIAKPFLAPTLLRAIERLMAEED